MSVAIKFEPRDLWVGVYWERDVLAPHLRLRVFICLLPCLPIILTFGGGQA